ncbi:MAG: glycosyltransferase [Candidatus Sumerlaeota bacterium]|nr:glycosyltransferase [Candidatus Sumerlaeota bacterium]
MSQTIKASIIIANWNGAAFVARALASVEASVRAAQSSAMGCASSSSVSSDNASSGGAPSGGDYEILVIDDASEDSSPEITERRFPQTQLLRNSSNLGYAATVNRGLREAKGDIAILLNNDIVIRADFIGRILKPFEAPAGDNLFAASAKTLQWTTGAANHLCMNGRWRRGWIEREWSDPPTACSALFVQGGACAVRRERALELGGMSTLYHPGYWEDYDLSYRAAKHGWRSLYIPEAVAFHLGKTSFEQRYGAEGVSALQLRNEMLFHWANLDDAALIAEHAWGLMRRLLGGVARGRLQMLKAALQAFARLPQVLQARRACCAASAVVSDRALLTPPPGLVPVER